MPWYWQRALCTSSALTHFIGGHACPASPDCKAASGGSPLSPFIAPVHTLGPLGHFAWLRWDDLHSGRQAVLTPGQLSSQACSLVWVMLDTGLCYDTGWCPRTYPRMPSVISPSQSSPPICSFRKRPGFLLIGGVSGAQRRLTTL